MSNIREIASLTLADIAGICDHTYLNRPEALKGKHPNPIRGNEEELNTFLENTAALPRKPYAICGRPEDIPLIIEFLNGHANPEVKEIKVASVVGFPSGSKYLTPLKVAEAEFALDIGAEEIDMVLDYDELRNSGKSDFQSKVMVRYDIAVVVNAVHKRKGLLKLILETSELSPEQIALVSTMADEIGVDMIKTSTGFSSRGASVENLKIMKANFSRGIKISGGVNKDNYKALLAAASTSGYIDLDPMKIRIGESSLLAALTA